jgi:uncharacterized small protein (DUF1192 family)
MRKFLISLAAAGAALAVATPAAAQYYPGQQYGGGYGSNGYGYNGYGYNNYGQVRALQARIDAVQWQIKRLDRYNAIRDGSADRLREESRHIEHRLHQAARYGLNPYEANDIQARIARLEARVQYASANRYGRYGHNGSYGFNGYYGDRDRDHDRWDGDRDDD